MFVEKQHYCMCCSKESQRKFSRREYVSTHIVWLSLLDIITVQAHSTLCLRIGQSQDGAPRMVITVSYNYLSFAVLSMNLALIFHIEKACSTAFLHTVHLRFQLSIFSSSEWVGFLWHLQPNFPSVMPQEKLSYLAGTLGLCSLSVCIGSDSLLTNTWQLQ